MSAAMRRALSALSPVSMITRSRSAGRGRALRHVPPCSAATAARLLGRTRSSNVNTLQPRGPPSCQSPASDATSFRNDETGKDHRL